MADNIRIEITTASSRVVAMVEGELRSAGATKVEHTGIYETRGLSSAEVQVILFTIGNIGMPAVKAAVRKVRAKLDGRLKARVFEDGDWREDDGYL